MKTYCIQYFDENDILKIAYIRSYSKEEAAEILRKRIKKAGRNRGQH